jgi:O-antigen ligase
MERKILVKSLKFSEDFPEPRFELRFLYWGAFFLPMIQLRLGIFTVSDTLFLASFLAALKNANRSRISRSMSIKWILLNIFMGLILALQTLYFSEDVIASLLGVCKLVFAITVVFFIVAHQISNFRIESQLVLYFSAGCAISAISAQLNLGSLAVSAGGVMRSGGLAGHPVGLAISSGSAIALLVQVLSFSEKGFATLFISVLILFNFVGLYVSVGITGLAIMSSGILVGLIFPSGEISRRISLIAFGGILFTLLSFSEFGIVISERIRGAFSPSQGLSTSSGQLNGSTVDIRIFTWNYGFRRILQHPLLGNGFDESGQYAYGKVATHNYFLLMWQAGGLLAFFISLAFAFVCVWSLITLWRSRFRFPKSQIGAVSIITSLVGAFTSPALYGRQLYFTIAIGVGFALKSRKVKAPL